MRVLYRTNNILLTLGALVLLPAAASALLSSSWPAGTVLPSLLSLQETLLVAMGFGIAPVLTWSFLGIARVFRRYGVFAGALLSTTALILLSNLGFWLLASARVSPIQSVYETGRIFWLGDHAFVFGHGSWGLSSGYWQHRTVVRLQDGSIYAGPTLDLLNQLRREGAHSVWGTWCYSGNYPFIRKDLVTGEETPWPSFVSYNRSPGRTVPIWLGASFVRLGWPQQRFTHTPEVFEYIPSDTLLLRRPSLQQVERAFGLVQRRVGRLPRPDSVVWYPVPPDTVRSLSWQAYRTLAPEERQALRQLEAEQSLLRARVGIAHYWIRGRAFPMYFKVPARVYRTLEPSMLTEDLLHALVHTDLPSVDPSPVE